MLPRPLHVKCGLELELEICSVVACDVLGFEEIEDFGFLLLLLLFS
jgi:hypothetical protein